MQFGKLIYVIATSAALFVSGLAIGQRTGTSKFAKYLQPAPVRYIDSNILEANVNLIRATLPMTDGISTPQIFFNAKQDQLQASVWVSIEFEKSSLDTVKRLISEKGSRTYLELKDYFPDLSEDDFVLRVIRSTLDPDRKLFAEYRHGNIVFH